MANKHIIFFIILFIAGCSLKENPPATVYNRTKDIKVLGQVSVPKGEAMLSVTWKYAKQIISGSTIIQAEKLQDCFRSEIVYDGRKDKSVHFLVNNYLCGTQTPLNSEPVVLKKQLPAQILFHSMALNILSANQTTLIFENR